jgi:hypothetical protein
VHPCKPGRAEHLEKMKALPGLSADQLDELMTTYNSIYFSEVCVYEDGCCVRFSGLRH